MLKTKITQEIEQPYIIQTRTDKEHLKARAMNTLRERFKGKDKGGEQ